jgi:hypothetical protein
MDLEMATEPYGCEQKQGVLSDWATSAVQKHITEASMKSQGIALSRITSDSPMPDTQL